MLKGGVTIKVVGSHADQELIQRIIQTALLEKGFTSDEVLVHDDMERPGDFWAVTRNRDRLAKAKIAIVRTY